MELYFNNIEYNINSNNIFESFSVNEEESKETSFADKVSPLFSDSNKASQVLSELGFGNNSNSNDTTQIIKNLDNLQNIVLSFKIQ